MELLVIDLNGTFPNQENAISQKNIQAIKKAQKKALN